MVERPFVDQPIGTAAAATPIARRAARQWGLPVPHLLRVGMNALFTAGDAVLRVGRPSAPPGAATELAAMLTAAGLRVPAPIDLPAIADGEIAVTAWEKLAAVDGEVDWRAVGAMVGRVHALDRDALPADYPVPPCESFPWWQLDKAMSDTADLVDEAASAGLRAAIERHRGWSRPTARVVCHGDVHPGNVLLTADGPVLLDWDLLCLGPRQWDHSMLLRADRWGGAARWYDDFAAGYGCSYRSDELAQDIAECRLVAATLMRLRAARTEPAAMPEARRRLAYWRGDTDAAAWQAV